MGRAVLLLFLFGTALSGPSPKIGKSAWDNILQVGSDIEIKSNGIESGRSDGSIEENVETYIKKHDVSFSLPGLGSKVTLDARNIDDEELNLKLNFGSGRQVEARKKSKLKKIFAPILVFIVIKAMTLIPLALGVLGIKTWNAIQLSFVSFVSALVMAVWKLCSKVNHEPPQIIHNAYDPHHHHLHFDRSDNVDPQQMAYAGYAPPSHN